MQNMIFVLAQAAAPVAAPGGAMKMMIPMALVFAIFYFLMIRPQQRKEKERRKAIETLRAGQKVLFAGGLIGTITESRPSTFLIEVAKNVQLEVARGAVVRVIAEGETVTLDEPRA